MDKLILRRALTPILELPLALRCGAVVTRRTSTLVGSKERDCRMHKTGQILAVAGLLTYFGACASDRPSFGNGVGNAGMQNATGGTATGAMGGAVSGGNGPTTTGATGGAVSGGNGPTTTGATGGAVSGGNGPTATGAAGGAASGGNGPTAGAGSMGSTKVPCTTSLECDDGNKCDGSEICALGYCAEEGLDQPDGTACPFVGGPSGAAGTGGAANGSFCTKGSCVPGRCGDGYRDALVAMEECDDANAQDGDGCKRNCTLTCSTTAECDDSEFCNGTEVCLPVTHTCAVGIPPANGALCTAGADKVCRDGQCVPLGQ